MRSPYSLAKKVALVTGGGSGIGLAIAERFRGDGAEVLIADRRAEVASMAAGIGACFIWTDVAIEAEFKAAFAEAITNCGRVDILINNAGIQPLGVSFDGLTESIILNGGLTLGWTEKYLTPPAQLRAGVWLD